MRLTAKLPDVVQAAWASGCTVADVLGAPMEDRVHCMMHDPAAEGMRLELLQFVKLNDFLDDYIVSPMRD